MDSPFIYCSGRHGTATLDYHQEGKDLTPLFDTILDYIEPPEGDPNGPLSVLVSSIDYNEYVGRIAVGRIERGTIHQNQEVVVCDYFKEDLHNKAKITAIYQIDGLDRTPVTEAMRRRYHLLFRH